MNRLKRGLMLVAFLSMAIPAAAHPVPFSFLDVTVQGEFLEVSLIVHAFDLAHDLKIEPIERLMDPAVSRERHAEIQALLAPRLQLIADGRVLGSPSWSEAELLIQRQSLRYRLRYAVESWPGTISVSAVMFPYDPVHQTFVNVYEQGDLVWQVILNRVDFGMEYVSGTRQGALAVVRRFLPSGIHHILIGPDHLLFLVGLLLLGGTTRRLLMVVTAFTAAHSVTLSLAALNLLNPPARLIEPGIALSIVYVGCDNILVRGGRDMRAWIAFAFGFIHGFGFANVLREMDLPSRALGWSLFSFNLGVEIGQLLVVIVVASALAALRSRNARAGESVAFAGSIIVILAGAFWFVERVFFPGGV